MGLNFTTNIKKKETKSHQIRGQSPSQSPTWGYWTQMINIGKLFENN